MSKYRSFTGEANGTDGQWHQCPGLFHHRGIINMDKFDIEVEWTLATNTRFPDATTEHDFVKVNAQHLIRFAKSIQSHVLREVTVTSDKQGNVLA